MNVNVNSSFLVVLTGGIASGKTTVSDLFSDLGVSVIDADIVAREVIKSQTVLQRLVDVFGRDILQPSGHNVDREKLKKLVFSDKDLLKQLNGIMHPAIKQVIDNKIKMVNEDICLVVIPLLKSKTYIDTTDRVLVVDVDVEKQLFRVQKRDLVSAEMAAKIIRSQPDRLARIEMADDVISNRFDLSNLRRSTLSLHRMYSAMARCKKISEDDEELSYNSLPLKRGL